MNPWHVLGLSPTGDLDAVKRAYAEKAKQYHPEEHPEQFQALHDAYRKAARYARQHRTTASPATGSAPAAPRKQTSDKPSFYTYAAEDNPRQNGRRRLADDEFTAGQFRDLCKENKRAGRVPRRSPAPAASLPKGKLPIRGAKREASPAGGLNFSAVEQPEPEPDPDPAPIQPDASPAPSRPRFWRVGALLLVLGFAALLAWRLHTG